ncbi:MAG: glycosyltransferase family 4 protein [Thioalkalivibrio sp.]|nr:glycosyltransferase family 4 protein [Thioalkalivibrio sp.]
MRVLSAHTYYTEAGGEDSVFENEARLLESRGHEVVRFVRRNESLVGRSALRNAADSLWNGAVARDFARVLDREKPEVVHVHNTFPAMSPAVLAIAKGRNVPVVASLHNPRLMCASANFFRDGRGCMTCATWPLAFPGVLRGCYRGSRGASAVSVAASAMHRLVGDWGRSVAAYVVFTEYYRQLFVRWGLPEDRLVLKPHFVEDRHVDRTPPSIADRTYAAFVGRLDPEKGALVVLEAWRALARRGLLVPLRVRGGGAHLESFEAAVSAEDLPIEIVGRLDPDELAEFYAGARFLVWPSLGSYETFGLVAIEAFSASTPVIAADGGVGPFIVQHGETGWTFMSGDPMALADAVAASWHRTDLDAFGHRARTVYEATYTPDVAYERLIGLYERVQQKNRAIG